MKLTYAPSALFWAGLTCLAVAGSACGGSGDGGVADDDSSSGSTKDDDDDGKGDKADNQCTGAQTMACKCANGKSGRRSCKGGTYGGCVCDAPTPQRDAGVSSNQNLCKAGYYAGSFVGKYKPGFAGFGVGMSQFEVDIMGKGTALNPSLAFTLNENQSGPVGEFYSFTVGNGCMQGSANAFGVFDNPFVARISGELDCSTGFFQGRLDGQYTLLSVSPVPSLFSGPLTAQFTLPQSLTDGEWMVQEPMALNGQAMGGGSGTWNAEWAADNPPSMATDPCANIMLIDGGMATPNTTTTTTAPTTPTTTRDGGVP